MFVLFPSWGPILKPIRIRPGSILLLDSTTNKVKVVEKVRIFVYEYRSTTFRIGALAVEVLQCKT